MDWTAIITAVVTGVLGIGAVAAFLTKWAPKLNKVAEIAEDITQTFADFTNALKPDADGKVTITAEELAQIKKDIAEIMADLKK